MGQQAIELILVRHLASRLAMPVFVVDADGDLVYFNEPAEVVLGRRFIEVRQMPFQEWTTAFLASAEGSLLAVDDLPLVRALKWREPAHREMEIVAGTGVAKRISLTAFPLEGPHGRHIGAVAMFWELAGLATDPATDPATRPA